MQPFYFYCNHFIKSYYYSVMSAEYIKAFTIGASWPAFVLYFYAVANYGEIRNYSFENYVFIAPLFLGLLNMFGLFISNEYNLSRRKRFILTGLIGATFVSIFITLTNAYNFKSKEKWIEQYIGLYLIYMFVFVIIVNNIDYYMNDLPTKDTIIIPK